ncbi:MAG: hypothetical protein D6703_01995 [Zetaproteobacteria bacterium]|nr:MAG: hypothetical protein D6703_01995 [Zetaproteobacteria bacterium]
MDAEDRVHDLIRIVRGVAIFAVPADIEASMIPTLTRKICDLVDGLQARGMVLDFANLKAADHGIMSGISHLAGGVRMLGVPVRMTGMSAGLASALVLTGFDGLHVRTCASLDQAIGELLSDATA